MPPKKNNTTTAAAVAPAAATVVPTPTPVVAAASAPAAKKQRAPAKPRAPKSAPSAAASSSTAATAVPQPILAPSEARVGSAPSGKKIYELNVASVLSKDGPVFDASKYQSSDRKRVYTKFAGLGPSQAARKAFTKICSFTKPKECTYEFEIVEQKSGKKHVYSVSRILRSEPQTVQKINKKDNSSTTLTINYNTVVRCLSGAARKPKSAPAAAASTSTTTAVVAAPPALQPEPMQVDQPAATVAAAQKQPHPAQAARAANPGKGKGGK